MQRGGLDVVVALVERAKEDLVAAIPSPRGAQSVGLAEALLRFEEGLREAADAGDAGAHGEESLDAWPVCREGLHESLRRAERFRLQAPDLDYEGLVGALGELIDPLEVFAEIEDASRNRPRPG